MSWIPNLHKLPQFSVRLPFARTSKQRMTTCGQDSNKQFWSPAGPSHTCVTWDMLFHLSESRLFICKTGAKPFTVAGRFVSNVGEVLSTVPSSQSEFSKCQ